jgi:hypothetical protein
LSGANVFKVERKSESACQHKGEYRVLVSTFLLIRFNGSQPPLRGHFLGSIVNSDNYTAFRNKIASPAAGNPVLKTLLEAGSISLFFNIQQSHRDLSGGGFPTAQGCPPRIPSMPMVELAAL